MKSVFFLFILLLGQSVRNTMKLTGKSSGTVQKIKRLIVYNLK